MKDFDFHLGLPVYYLLCMYVVTVYIFYVCFLFRVS